MPHCSPLVTSGRGRLTRDGLKALGKEGPREGSAGQGCRPQLGAEQRGYECPSGPWPGQSCSWGRGTRWGCVHMTVYACERTFLERELGVRGEGLSPSSDLAPPGSHCQLALPPQPSLLDSGPQRTPPMGQSGSEGLSPPHCLPSLPFALSHSRPGPELGPCTPSGPPVEPLLSQLLSPRVLFLCQADWAPCEQPPPEPSLCRAPCPSPCRGFSQGQEGCVKKINLGAKGLPILWKRVPIGPLALGEPINQ